MSTIGHPLSDLSNLLTPFSMAGRNAGLLGRVTSNDDFLPGRTRGLPPKEELIALYQQVAGWDPTFDLPWGEAFGLYRGSIILQGIAARYAVRQASSARAQEFGAGRVYMAELAWDLVQKAKSARGRASSKL